MENESNNIEQFINEPGNKFQIEFVGQNLEKNESFIKWKNKMKEIYGNDAKLFKCRKDKIYYFGKKSDCLKNPLYKIKCPICQLGNCYFCSKHTSDSYDVGYCCLYRRLYCLFFQKNIHSDEENFDDMFNFFIIPLFSFIYFVGIVSGLLFYKLNLANYEPTDKMIDYIPNYESHLDPSSLTFTIIIVFNVAFAVMLSFPFFILDIYFKIFLLLISIFSRKPLYYYLGLLRKLAL